MGEFSTAAANLTLKGYFGSLHVTGTPATLYVGVSGTLPSMTAGVISGATEPTNGAYARVAVTNNDTNFTVASRAVVNALDLTFPTATADWDAVATYWVVYDASTAGNIVAWGAATVAKTIYDGVTLVVPAGELSLTVNV